MPLADRAVSLSSLTERGRTPEDVRLVSSICPSNAVFLLFAEEIFFLCLQFRYAPLATENLLAVGTVKETGEGKPILDIFL